MAKRHKHKAKNKTRSASSKHRNTHFPAKRPNKRRRASNPYGVPFSKIVEGGGVALVAAVVTRAGPATLASLTGLANTGVVGYGMNVAFGALASWAAERFLKAGYPAAIGATVAIANRIVDDQTGVEVLNLNTFNMLRASGVDPTSAAAQASTTTPAAAGTSGLGKFDKKWSLLSGGYAGYRSTSFPPGTPYPNPNGQVRKPPVSITAGATGNKAALIRRGGM